VQVPNQQVILEYCVLLFMNFYFWRSHYNTNKRNKRISISAAEFDPASIERFRIYASGVSDTEAGNCFLRY
jgi:hypothetical protein